jgi:hypothetical protein
MSFDKAKIHLIPPLLQQRAEEMLNHKGFSPFKENYAAGFEAIIEYLTEVLQKYNSTLKFKRHKN